MMKTVLTIAGSDCSGGAGIQADIKTITAHKMYAMSAVTALTAQNTMGIYGVQLTTPEFLGKQLDCIFNDIRPDAVKIGMVSSAALIEVIAERLVTHKAKNIVVDTVMVSTSGSKLLSDNAIETLIKKLLPLATIITPNIPEAETFCGFKIITNEDMLKAAKNISAMLSANEFYKILNDRETRNEELNENTSWASILIKGGHLEDTADDLLYVQSARDGSGMPSVMDRVEQDQPSIAFPTICWFNSERISNPNTHGTGCALSSAIACNLAAGYCVEESVKFAKEYVKGALKEGLDLGTGNGPLNHMYNLRIYDTIINSNGHGTGVEMNIKGAIFDMDGTLLESMHIWETVGSDYLKSCSIEPAMGLREQIKTMSLRQSAEYFQTQYSLNLPIEDIMAGVNRTIADFYAQEVKLKPGALQLLQKLEQQGVIMCIATATDRQLVESALKTTNIQHFFKEILTCTEVGEGKESPVIFEKALEIMDVHKSETVLFEDALHAIQTAKNAGFTVIAVSDKSAEKDKAEIIRIADYYYDTLEEVDILDMEECYDENRSFNNKNLQFRR